MKGRESTYPRTMNRAEIWAVVLLGLALTITAFVGMNRKENEAYDRFLVRAPKIQSALESFAADHGGRFPPDSMFTRRPQGLSNEYISWDPTWNIDYEVRENGSGGHYVCLEFCGPYQKRRYFGLCNQPDMRKAYAQGQAIEGNDNRLWLIRENAAIMPPQPNR